MKLKQFPLCCGAYLLYQFPFDDDCYDSDYSISNDNRLTKEKITKSLKRLFKRRDRYGDIKDSLVYAITSEEQSCAAEVLEKEFGAICHRETSNDTELSHWTFIYHP